MRPRGEGRGAPWGMETRTEENVLWRKGQGEEEEEQAAGMMAMTEGRGHTSMRVLRGVGA